MPVAQLPLRRDQIRLNAVLPSVGVTQADHEASVRPFEQSEAAAASCGVFFQAAPISARLVTERPQPLSILADVVAMRVLALTARACTAPPMPPWHLGEATEGRHRLAFNLSRRHRDRKSVV